MNYFSDLEDYIDTLSCHGIPESEILITETKIGKLPKALHEFYLKYGTCEINQAFHVILSPQELMFFTQHDVPNHPVTNNQTVYLKFGVAWNKDSEWAIKKEDMRVDNPEVYSWQKGYPDVINPISPTGISLSESLCSIIIANEDYL
ncbi:hypothetical protein [Listeria costaricensis]|uniref:hypothetical protein n=1 Tax=Listeria costaricensis TaxID=2026604 RepID=UPI000C0777C6|nr:hypothetical protein [Listeria costaricensis]